MGAMITDTPTTIAELRMHVAIKLTVAPRHILTALAKPSTPALDRERLREELVEFITRDLARWSFTKPVDNSPYRGGPDPCHR